MSSWFGKTLAGSIVAIAVTSEVAKLCSNGCIVSKCLSNVWNIDGAYCKPSYLHQKLGKREHVVCEVALAWQLGQPIECLDSVTVIAGYSHIISNGFFLCFFI